MPNLTVNDVADYLLAQMSEESGDTISNLKLQKLVYYAQGFYLAAHGKALFREQIKAWDHGPVVPPLWHRFKEHGNSALPKPDRVSYSRFSKSERDHLDEIFKLFDQFSAWKLRNMTHKEPPWTDTARNGVITHAAMKSYFKTMLA